MAADAVVIRLIYASRSTGTQMSRCLRVAGAAARKCVAFDAKIMRSVRNHSHRSLRWDGLFDTTHASRALRSFPVPIDRPWCDL